MYDLDLYTVNGTILHHECQTLSEVFDIISDSIDFVQLLNLTKL